MAIVDNLNETLQTDSEWFVAKITKVVPAASEEETFKCSWISQQFTENLQRYLEDENASILYGDAEENINPALPIDPDAPQPNEGTLVLMRLRGTNQDDEAGILYTYYEFLTFGGGAAPTTSDSCFIVKSIQCNNGILQAVMADGACSGCSSGAILYELTPQNPIEVTTNTPFAIPNAWSTVFGDLVLVGLEQDGASFKNSSQLPLTLKITLQVSFTPQGVGATQSRWAFIGKGSTTNVPIASMQSSNQTYSTIVATGFIQLNADETFTPYCFQDGGAGIFIGDTENQKAKTTLAIEKYCN